MAKYSQEFKLKVVEYYLTTGNGYIRTGQYFSVERTMVRRWVRAFKDQGISALELDKPRTAYSPEFKHKVVLVIINEGLSTHDVAQKFQLKQRATVSIWLKQYMKHGIDGFAPKPKGRAQSMPKSQIPRADPNQADHNKTHKELLEELEYLRAENAFLKKRRALRLAQEAQQQKRQN